MSEAMCPWGGRGEEAGISWLLLRMAALSYVTIGILFSVFGH